MSEVLQFEQHPDADAISAFVEQALPAHEREQLLGHLAVCTECRAIVALSLPPTEKAAEPLSVRSLRWKWNGWAFAWPVAAALAGLAAFAVYLHRSPVGPQDLAAHQIAKSEQAPRQTAIGQLDAPAAEQRKESHAQIDGKSFTNYGRAAAAEPQEHPHAALSARSIETMQTNGRNLEVLAPRPGSEAAEASKNKRDLSAAPVVTMGTGWGAGSEGAIGAQHFSENDLEKAAPERSAAAAAPAASRAMPTAVAPAGRSNQTINVADAARMKTEPANLDLTLNEMQVAKLEHPLPSRLPVISIANQTRRIVAIDMSNQVFLSKDEGRHWMQVQNQWPGRAVSAGVVEVQSVDTKRKVDGVAGGLYTIKAASKENKNRTFNAPARVDENAASASLTGRVTDSTGAAVSGASIAATNAATHMVRNATTDNRGQYSVNGLAPGDYKVAAQARGFERQELSSVAVDAGQPAVANLSLNVGAATQTVTVEADTVSVSAAEKKVAKRAALSQPASYFEITTDDGERWTSADGVTWTHIDSPSYK